jgi:hypothetical protein
MSDGRSSVNQVPRVIGVGEGFYCHYTYVDNMGIIGTSLNLVLEKTRSSDQGPRLRVIYATATAATTALHSQLCQNGYRYKQHHSQRRVQLMNTLKNTSLFMHAVLLDSCGGSRVDENHPTTVQQHRMLSQRCSLQYVNMTRR